MAILRLFRFGWKCLFGPILGSFEKRWDNIARLYFTYMEKSPNNSTVTKFCVWVPFPNVINCARFHLYWFNSILGTDPKNCLFPLTWKVMHRHRQFSVCNYRETACVVSNSLTERKCRSAFMRWYWIFNGKSHGGTFDRIKRTN